MPPTTNTSADDALKDRPRHRIDSRRLTGMRVADLGGGWHGGDWMTVHTEIPARFGDPIELNAARRSRAHKVIAAATKAALTVPPLASFGALMHHPRAKRDQAGYYLAPLEGTYWWVNW